MLNTLMNTYYFANPSLHEIHGDILEEEYDPEAHREPYNPNAPMEEKREVVGKVYGTFNVRMPHVFNVRSSNSPEGNKEGKDGKENEIHTLYNRLDICNQLTTAFHLWVPCARIDIKDVSPMPLDGILRRGPNYIIKFYVLDNETSIPSPVSGTNGANGTGNRGEPVNFIDRMVESIDGLLVEYENGNVTEDSMDYFFKLEENAQVKCIRKFAYENIIRNWLILQPGTDTGTPEKSGNTFLIDTTWDN